MIDIRNSQLLKSWFDDDYILLIASLPYAISVKHHICKSFRAVGTTFELVPLHMLYLQHRFISKALVLPIFGT